MSLFLARPWVVVTTVSAKSARAFSFSSSKSFVVRVSCCCPTCFCKSSMVAFPAAISAMACDVCCGGRGDTLTWSLSPRASDYWSFALHPLHSNTSLSLHRSSSLALNLPRLKLSPLSPRDWRVSRASEAFIAACLAWANWSRNCAASLSAASARLVSVARLLSCKNPKGNRETSWFHPVARRVCGEKRNFDDWWH